jgi:hypothetical protein
MSRALRRRPPLVEACLVALALMSPLPARLAGAGELLELRPSGDYHVDWWRPGSDHELHINLTVRRAGPSSVDHFMQVAPGGETLVGCDPSARLVLYAASGGELWHRDGRTSAFRFSPSGAELAIASDKGIDLLEIAGRQPRALLSRPGIEWLRWIDGGLLARARDRLYAVDHAGHERSLAKLPAGAVVAASPRRIVYFAQATMVDLDLATGRSRSTTKLADRAPVIDAELSPDGNRVLFATANHVYAIDRESPPTKLADVEGLRSLSFSADGSSYLWVSWSGGALIANGKTTPLPMNAIAARYRQDRSVEIVVTSEPGGVSLWNPVTGKQTPTGGVSADDAKTLAADFAGGSPLLFLVRRPAWEKKQRAPTERE